MSIISSNQLSTDCKIEIGWSPPPLKFPFEIFQNNRKMVTLSKILKIECGWSSVWKYSKLLEIEHTFDFFFFKFNCEWSSFGKFSKLSVNGPLLDNFQKLLIMVNPLEILIIEREWPLRWKFTNLSLDGPPSLWNILKLWDNGCRPFGNSQNWV